ncbi:MAG: GspH/FimT family pseudopilin [Burkholderiaceae bacterium]|nr:GspH/FimT family pseudopilin [Burkholderiaceae bacterium]
MQALIERLAGQRGRTLLEMLVALAIAAILLCAALPTGHALLRRQQLQAAVADLHAALDTARALAIARGSVIVVAPHAGGWERGWTIFADRDGDAKPGPDDEIILEQGVLADGIHIRMKFTGSASQDYIAYNSAGRSCRADKSQTARWGTLTVEAGPQQYLVRINMLGRARVCDPKKDGAACTG